jgi:predicted ATPase
LDWRAEEELMLTAGTKLGHYEVLSQLGAGGMGEVWRARDTRLNREVAIKVLPASFANDADRLLRFEQEARATSALNHPNIVTIHELGEVEAGRFIVMELVEGRTLRALIDEALLLDAFAQLGSQMAKALGAAHAAGITHRDIKPENIMVRDDGYVKVLDFGLARLVPTGMDKEAATLQYTQPGTLLGSARYMSPEQARGESVSHPSDIFSLGMIFYEMATGRHPFATDSILGTLNAIAGQVPVTPSRLNPEIPSAIETLILQMLEKDARLRPAAAEVETALAEIGGQTLSVESRPAVTRPRTCHTVGREKAHAELREALASVFAGKGFLVCVPGEPGMGKTTLVEDFLSDLRAGSQACIIARGRCSERLAGTEAYLPWLEALDSLLRGAGGQLQARTSVLGSESIAQTTKRLAPTWYAQVMPLQPDDSSVERMLAERAASQERMKREVGALLQEVSERQPLVLFFDDLHWADISTIDLLAYLASKFDSMRVLIVATYRPSDLLLAKHPFLQVRPDLQARGVCREIELEFLSRSEIEKYLALEFPEHRFPAELPALIHAKTEGNPLFMADLVRYLRDRQVIAEEHGRWVLAQSLPSIERDLPESVRGMIERKIAQLSEEDRRLLVAASVQGYEFDSAVVAKVLAAEAGEVEERLDVLERVHAFVRLAEEREFPDRTLTLRYRFVHVLYQNALYAQLRPTRKAHLSAAVAHALLDYYGEQSTVVASELALLFEAARDFSRAADYFLLAAQNAARVFADQEAAMLASLGLELLKTLPETPERTQQELALQVALGTALRATKGFGAPEVGKAYERARELCQHTGERSELVPVLRGLWEFYELRAEYQTALEFGEQLLTLAQHLEDPSLLLVAHDVLGDTSVWLGEFVAAREHLEQGIAFYDTRQHRSHIFLYGYDSGMACLCFAAEALCHLGYPDQALKRIDEALILARELSQPMGLAFAPTFAAWLHQLRGEGQAAQERAETAIAISAEHGIPFLLAWGMIMRGWALVGQGKVKEGAAQIRQGIDAYRATGAELGVSWFLGLLAGAYGEAGQTEEGLALLAEALDFVSQTGERFYEAELYRLRGELLLKSEVHHPSSEAASCFRQAIEIARRQQAKSLELRAVMSLARLWQQQGKREEGRAILADIYGWFTEGFDTADLKDARVLLDELSMEGSLQAGDTETEDRPTT